MEVRVKDETFVFDVELTKGKSEVVTLDFFAGVHVWPRGRCEDVPMMPKKEGLSCVPPTRHHHELGPEADQVPWDCYG